MAATPQPRVAFRIICLSPSCSLILVYRVLLCACFPYMLWFAQDNNGSNLSRSSFLSAIHVRRMTVAPSHGENDGLEVRKPYPQAIPYQPRIQRLHHGLYGILTPKVLMRNRGRNGL